MWLSWLLAVVCRIGIKCGCLGFSWLFAADECQGFPAIPGFTENMYVFFELQPVFQSTPRQRFIVNNQCV